MYVHMNKINKKIKTLPMSHLTEWLSKRIETMQIGIRALLNEDAIAAKNLAQAQKIYKLI